MDLDGSDSSRISLDPGARRLYAWCMSRSEEFTSVFRGLHIPALIDPRDADEVTSRLRLRPEDERQNPNFENWPIFGQHWSTKAEVSRQFALRQANTTNRHRPHIPQTRDRSGIVLEARSQQPPRSSLGEQDWRGESEVWPARRGDISEVLAHVHVRRPDMKHRDDTRVATHVVPPEMWRNA